MSGVGWSSSVSRSGSGAVFLRPEFCGAFSYGMPSLAGLEGEVEVERRRKGAVPGAADLM